MRHERDLFACSPAMGKLVNTINTNYKKLALRPVTSPFSDIYHYRKIPKLSPGAIFFKGPF